MNGRSFTLSTATPVAAESSPTLRSVTRLVGEAVDLPALLGLFHPRTAGASLFVDPDGGEAIVSEGVAWQAPGGERGLAGWGEAASAWRALVASARLEGPGPDAPGPILIGGAAFDAEAPVGALWRAFGRGRLLLPRRAWTLLRDGRLYECLSTVEGAPSAPSAAVPAGGEDTEPEPEAAGGEGEARFRARIDAARAAVARGDLEKLVVARRWDVASRMAPEEVLARLAGRERTSFTFALAAGGEVFCGSTPELLARLRADRVESVCLAATAARGEGAGADRRLGDRLRSDRKELREHDLVRQGVARALLRTCDDIVLAPRPSLRALADVQHLATPVRARLRPGFDLLDVARDLHPTPAVAGLPQTEAALWLRRFEGLRRGLYAGPVGFLRASGEGVLAVALRSALLRPEASKAHLFAGCGIVAASEAGREWQESRLKMRTMATALGVAEL